MLYYDTETCEWVTRDVYVARKTERRENRQSLCMSNEPG